MGQIVHLRGGLTGLPAEVIEDLPQQLIIEYPATISIAYDMRTGQVTQARVQGIPDRCQIFDRDSWHELPQDDSSVRAFRAHFDPRAPLRAAGELGDVQWLDPDNYLLEPPSG